MNKFIKLFSASLFLVSLLFLNTNIAKANDVTGSVTVEIINFATLTTTTCSAITQTGVISGGNITSDGGSAITSRGIVWSTSTNPTTALPTKTSNGTGVGNFSSNATPLNPGIVYYVRAYAVNSVGTSYGNEISCTTLAVPTVINPTATGITQTSANLGAEVTSLGVPAVISARGTCRSESSDISYPTDTNKGIYCANATGTTTGVFTQPRGSLTCGTKYYYKGYAINATGIGWTTEEATFTTLPCNPGTPTTTVGACGSGSITVSWPSSSGIVVGYQLRDGTTSLYDSNGTSFTHTGLADGSSHSYSVRSKNLSGYSSYVYTVPGTTIAPSACPPSVYPLTLIKSNASTGTGTVTGVSNPVQTNINCGTACSSDSKSYSSNTYIELTATPSAGSVFAGWSGDCTNATGKCAVTIDKAKSVTATFNAVASNYTLTVTKTDPSNSAIITSTPTGISCGADCNESYASGTNVTINAPAVSGYSVAISNGCIATGTVGTGASCSVTMDAAKTVNVIYTFVNSKITPTCSIPTSTVTYNGSQQYPSTINISPVVNGVMSDIKFNGSTTIPTNANTYAVTIDFAPTDTATYNSLSDASCGNFIIAKANQSTLVFNGQTITNGSNFSNPLTVTGGSGGGAVSYAVTTPGAGCLLSGANLSYSTTGSCIVTATKAGDSNYNDISDTGIFTVEVSANPSTYRLTLVKNGSGSGDVYKDGAYPVNNVVGDFSPNTEVHLGAQANSGSTFTNWSGCTTYGGTNPLCYVTMDSSKTVTATFNSTTPPTPTNPVISSFTVSSPVIIGQSPKASWSSTGATSCQITGDDGTDINMPSTSTSGNNYSLSPKPSKTTTYTLTCYNSDKTKSDTDTKTVKVIDPNYQER